MFDWLKKKKRKDGRPTWSGVLNATQEQRFDELVDAYFASTGENARAENGFVNLGTLTMGLGNLVQVCRSRPHDEWPDAIEEHFSSLKRAREDEDEWEGRKGDFNQVASDICLRLYPDSYEDGEGVTHPFNEIAVTRTDLPCSATALVVDRPTIVMTVKKELPAVWGRDTGELFELALSNLEERFPVQVAKIDLEPGVTISVLEGEHVFVASHALRIDAWPELIGAHGTLLAVPNRHSVLAWPIDGTDVIKVASKMAQLAFMAFKDGPGSIVPHVYWRSVDGTYALLEVSVEGKAVALKPSPEFLRRMEHVAAGGAG